MTENKRFGMVKTKYYDLYVPVDEMKFYIFPSFEDELDCIRVVNALNDLEEKSRVNGKLASQYLEENEQLKEDNMLLIEDSEKYRKLSIQFDNRNKELISENEQLKSICKDHRDHAIDFKADCVRLEKENEELKKENEKWKSIACDNSSFNSILLHELDIAKEQGYTVSDPFKKLMGKCE